MQNKENDNGANAFIAMMNEYVAEVDLSIHANTLYSIYSAYVKAGFTNEQAMQIICCMLMNATNKNNKKE